MKNLFPLLFGIAVSYVIYQVICTVMYNVELAHFHNTKWIPDVNGVSMNGRPSYGDMININQLEAITPESGAGSVAEWCPGITSSRGHVSMSEVSGTLVCCLAPDSSQFLVPFKIIGPNTHVMCGKWPLLDHVILTGKQSSPISSNN